MRNSPTPSNSRRICSIAEGNTFMPRMTTMSSVRPRMPCGSQRPGCPAPHGSAWRSTTAPALALPLDDVARAVAYDREAGARECGHDDLARLAVGDRRAGLGAEDLGDELVLA